MGSLPALSSNNPKPGAYLSLNLLASAERGEAGPVGVADFSSAFELDIAAAPAATAIAIKPLRSIATPRQKVIS
jgi:hypothetical protein